MARGGFADMRPLIAHRPYRPGNHSVRSIRIAAAGGRQWPGGDLVV